MYITVLAGIDQCEIFGLHCDWSFNYNVLFTFEIVTSILCAKTCPHSNETFANVVSCNVIAITLMLWELDLLYIHHFQAPAESLITVVSAIL